MPLSLAADRRSAIHVGVPWRGTLPLPDGTISQADRAQVASLYGGTLSSAARTLQGSEIHVGLPWRGVLPVVDGSVDIGDRHQVAAYYRELSTPATRTLQGSNIHIGLPWRGILPISDGSVNIGDRLQVAAYYRELIGSPTPTPTPILLRRNGKFLRQSGNLMRASAASYAEFLRCCCGSPDCTCAAVCSAPYYRMIVQGKACPDPAVCTTSETVVGNFVEGDATMIPGTQPPGTSLRYWTATPTLAYGDPAEPLLELACTNIDGGSTTPQMYFRIDSGAWCLIRNTAECIPYWTSTSAVGAAINTINGGCGVYVMQAWCDPYGEPAPECDLAPTGAC